MGYKFIKILKHSGDCPTMLTVNDSGVLYVQKLLDSIQLDIYQKLSELKIAGIPKIAIVGFEDMVLPDFMEEMREELISKSSALLIEEYIEGSDLEKLIDSGYKFNRKEFKRLMLSLCKTMHKVHKAGIVHRDIKPANIIRSDNGRYYIIDFGIARKPAQSNTQTKIIATLGYASPEQLEGKRATCESDIYSIGRIMKDIMPKSRAYRRIYKKATMDDPQSRYRTARSLANAIRLIPIVRLIITAVILAILFFSWLFLIGGDENGGDFSKTLSESVYGESLTSEELSTEEQRLQSEIANGNDGIDNYICLSGIYESKGDTDKAADVLIEYIDNVYDRRLYLSASPIYQRLENLKAYTTVDKQAEILELNGNADYIDRLLDAGEYERSKQVLDDIKANPCRELVRSKFLQLDDYYYRLYEKTEDYENAASAIFDIYENFYGGTGKLGKDTLYCKNLQSLYDKVSEETQKRIDKICE